MAETTIQIDIDEFRSNFDAMYLGGIPNLINDDGAFLAFLAALTATDALAGFYGPQFGAGIRFTNFVDSFYPKDLAKHANALWKFRNAMVHSFNPGPFMLVFHQSRLHLTTSNGVIVLNAEDYYSALVSASRSYFETLLRDPELQAAFAKRLADSDGGGIQSYVASKATEQ